MTAADDALPPGVTCRPICEHSAVALADAMVRIFADYVSPPPAGFDATSWESRFRAEHLDRVASLLVVAEERIVGTVLVARRGRIAHLSGLGVHPQWRRRGLATMLLRRVCREARARGDREIAVEVPSHDQATQRMYATLGFAARRQLLGYSMPAPAANDAPLEEIEPATVAAIVAAAGADLPWFYQAGTLAGCALPMRAYALSDRGVGLVSPVNGQLGVRALYVRPEHRRQRVATTLLAAAATRHRAQSLVVQPLFPADLWPQFFSATGFAPLPLRHHEMTLTLTAPPASG